MKHTGGVCHLQSAPGPCCGAGDEGTQLEWGQEGAEAPLQPPQGEPGGQRGCPTPWGTYTPMVRDLQPVLDTCGA